ncbi:hypothetical protein WMY93_030874 [Mugilogobius chulae]|uniref:Uncharacterized protein n=1 Tax=Mugilogobius chulae TaxID=88201 RepID=A0AAW0MKJ9_9GOBI
MTDHVTLLTFICQHTCEVFARHLSGKMALSLPLALVALLFLTALVITESSKCVPRASATTLWFVFAMRRFVTI